MESRQLILAIVLSCVVFLGWNYLATEMGWRTDPATMNATTPMDESLPTPSEFDPAAPATQPSLEAEGEASPVIFNDSTIVTVTTPLYRAVFFRQGGVLKEFSLLQYRLTLDDDEHFVTLASAATEFQAPMAMLVNGIPSWKGTDWLIDSGDIVLREGESGTLSFQGIIDGMRIKRSLTFSGDTYLITESAQVTADQDKKVNLAFTIAAQPSMVGTPTVLQRIKQLVFGGKTEGANNPYNPTRVAWYQDNKYSEEGDASDLTSGVLITNNIEWIGVMNNYFAGLVSLTDTNAIAKGGYDKSIFTALLGKTNVSVGPTTPAILEGTYFIGPKEVGVMAKTPDNMGAALNYGFFSIIAKPLVYLLDFFYNFVGNYGYAIILMTVVIKIILWPLSHKSFKSMEGMRKLQPLMQEIRERHKDDKDAMNKEIMAAYKRYKVNPAGGCLPILLQLPIFLGLYNALLNAVELRHAPFIAQLPFTDLAWLVDLSAPDPFFITPLIMGATMFLQQRMAPPPGDPTQAKIMLFMPIVFTVFFLGFPSGLVLYWLVSNVISIAQQKWQLRNKE